MIETGRGIAHPWLCDAMGHLNVRYHAAVFDDASFHFLTQLVGGGSVLVNAQHGWADVTTHVDYRCEVPMGAAFLIRTGLVRLGNSSLTYRQIMRTIDGLTVYAEQTTKSVYFNLVERRASPVPAEARKYLAEHAELLAVD